MTDAPARVREVAGQLFGHRELLPGQEQAIGGVLHGRDVLLVAPTGWGKSLTYQVAGTLLGRCTVVVSPLLALQNDQIRALEDVDGVAAAARISSAETEGQRRAAVEGAGSGEVGFLYLAPEQLANDDLVDQLAALEPALVAVDEAHCVSAWGHDFRPDYGRLGEFIERLGSPRTLAMTATAAPPVRADIVERLRMRDPVEVVAGFARDNLALAVHWSGDESTQRQAVLDHVHGATGPGIVYCRTRRATDEYAAALAEAEVRTASYHAGMGRRRRESAHDEFLGGRADVMVATSAFGMGIDKPDIRFVLHAQVPESVDTYYQEVGRGGRDGDPAEGVLFYRPEDLALGRFFAGGIPDRDDVLRVLGALPHSQDARTTREALRRATGLGARRIGRVLNLVAEVSPSVSRGDVPAVADAVIERAEAHRALERSRVDMMRAYAETGRCRADFILGYFGEASAGDCGHCDNCRGQVTHASADRTTASGLGRGTHVRHRTFGTGTVTEVEADRVTVLFDDVGYRQLSLDVVESEGLLRRDHAS